MSIGAEIRSSIHGAWRIALTDPNALRYFNLSADGFWRSFIAVPIAFAVTLPKYLLRDEVPAADALAEPSAPVMLLFGLIGWLLYVVVMIWITRLLNLAATYAQYIIVWNWASVIGTLFMLPISLFPHDPASAGGLGAVLPLMFYFALLYYGFRVARVGLACTVPIALGIMVFELVLNLFIYKAALFIL